MMGLLLTAIKILGRGNVANWRLISGIALGMFIAVTSVASAPMYLNAVTQLGLSHDISKKELRVLDIQLYSRLKPVNRSDYQRASNIVAENTPDIIKNLVRSANRFVRTPQEAPFEVIIPDAPLEVERFGVFQFITDLERHISVLKGEYLSDKNADSSSHIEVMVGAESAMIFGYSPGQEFFLLPTRGKNRSPIPVKVVGVIEAKDIEDEYWLGHYDMFYILGDEVNEIPPKATFFVTEEVLFDDIGNRVPGILADYWWFFYITPEFIKSTNAEEIYQSLEDFRVDVTLGLPRSTVFTGLIPLFEKFEVRSFYTKIPLFILVSLVFAASMYYVMLMSVVLVESQRSEIALLVSRGSKFFQVLLVYLANSLLLAIPIAFLGPALGASIVALLGKTFVFSGLSGGEYLPVYLTLAVPVFILITIVLSMLSLLIPAYFAARKSTVAYKMEKTRPSGLPFFQRYYIDIVLIALGGFFFWELEQRQSLVTNETFGETDIDQMLLAAPIVFVVSVSLLMLRLFPLIVSIIYRVIAPISALWIMLSFWQIIRNPTHHLRLMLLLTLVVTLGTFAATFGGTLNRSFEERVFYSTGSDIRIAVDSQEGDIDLAEVLRLHKSEGKIEEMSFAFRRDVELIGPGGLRKFTALGVDPRTFDRVAWYRNDFSKESLPEMLLYLLDASNSHTQGIPIVKDAKKLGLWVRPNMPYPNVSLAAWIRDGDGKFYDLMLGPMESDEWKFYEVDMPSLTYPTSFHGFYIRDSYFGGVPRSITFLVDDLQITGDLGSVVIENFENINEWHAFSGPSISGDSFSLNPASIGGEFSGEFSVKGGQSSPSNVHGAYVSANPVPVPVIASDSFYESPVGDLRDVAIGDNVIRVEIKGISEYFPTMGDLDRNFLIFNVNHLLYYSDLFPSLNKSYYNQFWLSMDEGDVTESTIRELQAEGFGIHDFEYREELLLENMLDPFVAAGFSGLFLMTITIVVVIGIAGYLGFLWMTLDQRNLFFSVTKALGVSFRNIFGYIVVEQSLIVLVSVLAGSVIGYGVTFLLTDFFAHDAEGNEILPQFTLAIDWNAFLVMTVVIFGLLLIVISRLSWRYVGIKAHKVFRMGEE